MRPRNSNPDEMRRAKARATKHIEFMSMMHEEQLKGGRYLLHEHPMFATSWQLSRIKNLMEMDCVKRVRGDQCQCGATAARGPKKDDPVMQPTGFLSNSPEVLKALSRRCTGRHGICLRP